MSYRYFNSASAKIIVQRLVAICTILLSQMLLSIFLLTIIVYFIWSQSKFDQSLVFSIAILALEPWQIIANLNEWGGCITNELQFMQGLGLLLNTFVMLLVHIIKIDS